MAAKTTAASCLLALMAWAGCAPQPKCFECGLNKEWARAEAEQRRQRAEDDAVERFGAEDPHVVARLADEVAANPPELSTHTLQRMLRLLRSAGSRGSPSPELATQRARAFHAVTLAVGEEARPVLEYCIEQQVQAELCREARHRLDQRRRAPAPAHGTTD